MESFKPWVVYTVDRLEQKQKEKFIYNANLNDCELIEVDFSEIHNWERFCRMMWTKFNYPKFHCETIDELFEWYGGSPNFNAFWDWFRDPDFYIKKACVFDFRSLSEKNKEEFIDRIQSAYMESNSFVEGRIASEQGNAYMLVITGFKECEQR
ncbi:MAG: hypothetical protein ACRCV7_06880 [Culicoidibacterales bacterium]